MQRLFSMFPNGWPGIGLLVLRLGAASLLIHDGIVGLMGERPLESLILQVIAAIAGILLLVGLYTPIAGALVTITELWMTISGTGQLRAAILLATIGIAIAVLGPGAWSIDARFFGRMRLDI